MSYQRGYHYIRKHAPVAVPLRVRLARRRPILAAVASAVLALGAGLAIIQGATGASAQATADPLAAQLDAARQAKANCDLLASAGSTSTLRAHGRTCSADQAEIIRLLLTQAPTPTPSASATSAPPTTTTSAPTTPPVTTTTAAPSPTPTPTSGPPAGDTLFCAPMQGPAGPFPDEHCTGWRHTGVTLHPCGDPRGSATHLETAGAVYDGCEFADAVVIQAANITIRRSWIHGVIKAHFSHDYDYLGAQVIDTEIGPSTDPDLSAVSAGPNITLLRVNAHDTASGVALGNNSSLIDSWVHDRLDTGAHGSAVGVGQGSGSHTVVMHNRLDCAPPTGAEHCSGAAVFYDENGVTLDDVLVKFNLFDSISGYCFRNGPDTRNIRVISNVFGRKYHPECGLFGPVSAFYVGNLGNEWTGNVYPDGTVVNASSS